MHFQRKTSENGTHVPVSLLVLFWAATGVFLLPMTGGTTSQQEELGATVDDTFYGSFNSLWARYRGAESLGDAELASRLLEEIRRLRAERNVFNLHDIAMSFVFTATFHEAQGDHDRAYESYEIARELDPTLPTVYHGLARLARGSGGLGIFVSMGHDIQGLIAAFRSMGNGDYTRANIAITGSISLLLAFGLIAALMLYRYAVLIQHDVSERLEEKIGKSGARAASLAVFLLPLMLTAGAGWLIPYWLVITFVYQSWRERSVSMTALVLIFFLSPLFEFHARWSETVVNPLYQASMSTEDGTFELVDLLLLQAASERFPEDRDLHFLIATQYKNLGEYEYAASRYREVLQQSDGDDLAARVNLGNIYFAQRDWEGALLEYNGAIEDYPDSAFAHYNKSLAHAENFQFRERENARAKAESVDAGSIVSHERRTGERRAVADIKLGADAILAKFYGLEQEQHPSPVSPTWIGALGGAGFRFVFGALMLGVLAIVLERSLGRDSAQRCLKCGRAFCNRCQIGKGRRGLCTQCFHLFFVRDGVSAAARNEKMLQVRKAARNRGLVFRVLSLVSPGAGHIAEDMPLFGVPLLVLWVGGIVLLLSNGRLYPFPDHILGLGSSFALYVAVGVFLALLLVVANVVAQRRLRR